MATLNLPKSSYSLYRPLEDDGDNGLFLARRTTDGEILLARPLYTSSSSSSNAEQKATADLIRHGAALPAANLLNHENLISIHDELANIPFNHHSNKNNNNDDDADP